MHPWICRYIELLSPVMLGCCHLTMYRSDSLEQNTVIMNVCWLAAETGDMSLTRWSQSIACGIKRSRLLPSLLSCISLLRCDACLDIFYEGQCHCYSWEQLIDRWWAMSCFTLLRSAAVLRHCWCSWAHRTSRGVWFCSDADERQE